jgi:hypothetical protein
VSLFWPGVDRCFVVRSSPLLPPEWMPADWEGRWFPMDRFGFDPSDPAPDEGKVTGPDGSVVAILVRTGRFERRDDGASALVYEFWPAEPMTSKDS